MFRCTVKIYKAVYDGIERYDQRRCPKSVLRVARMCYFINDSRQPVILNMVAKPRYDSAHITRNIVWPKDQPSLFMGPAGQHPFSHSTQPEHPADHPLDQGPHHS